MNARTLAMAISGARVAIGIALLVAPGRAARPWIGADADRVAVKALARGFGARDLALGLGTLFALRRGSKARGWMEAGAVCDALDAGSVLLSWRGLPSPARALVLATASTAAVTNVAIANVIDTDAEAVDDENPLWVPREPGRSAA